MFTIDKQASIIKITNVLQLKELIYCLLIQGNIIIFYFANANHLKMHFQSIIFKIELLELFIDNYYI